jgi:uncharacterized protein (TIGR03067 family)
MASNQSDPVLQFIRNVTARGCADSATDAQLLARFLAQHDEAAFALLVQRHGPMILGVCRRVLHQAHDVDKKSDKERLQGTWVPVSVELGGKKLSNEELKEKDFKTVFDGDSVTMTVQTQNKEMTYKLDPSKKPKHIDLVNSKGEVTRGIYLLDGNTLKLCAPDTPGEDRPT